MTMNTGTVLYVAPEKLSCDFQNSNEFRGQGYSSASDVWSLGIMLYELIMGITPFHNIAINTFLLSSVICDKSKSVKLKYDYLANADPRLVDFVNGCNDRISINRTKLTVISLLILRFSIKKTNFVSLKNLVDFQKIIIIKLEIIHEQLNLSYKW